MLTVSNRWYNVYFHWKIIFIRTTLVLAAGRFISNMSRLLDVNSKKIASEKVFVLNHVKYWDQHLCV